MKMSLPSPGSQPLPRRKSASRHLSLSSNVDANRAEKRLEFTRHWYAFCHQMQLVIGPRWRETLTEQRNHHSWLPMDVNGPTLEVDLLSGIAQGCAAVAHEAFVSRLCPRGSGSVDARA